MLTGSALAERRRYVFSRFSPSVRRARRFELDMGGAEWRALVRETTPSVFEPKYREVIRPLLEQTERCLLFVYDPLPIVARLEKRWEDAGIRPSEQWAGYFVTTPGRSEITLGPAVLDDALFWWWVFPGLAQFDPVFVTSLERFNAQSYFRRGADPTLIGNRGPESALKLAKSETARDRRVAFVFQRLSLSLSVVSSGEAIVDLFETAVANARFTY